MNPGFIETSKMINLIPRYQILNYLIYSTQKNIILVNYCTWKQ